MRIKRIFFLAMGMFVVGCNSFMMAGLLPQVGQSISQPLAITSQGITLFRFAYFISAPIFSIVFANRYAKQMIQFSLFLFLLGNLITLFSNQISLFLIGRVISGVGAGFFTPLCITIAIYLIGFSQKGKILSVIWGANSAGVVFGVPLGIQISTWFSWRVSIAYILTLGLFVLGGISFQNLEMELPVPPATIRERLRLLGDQNILLVIGISCFTAMACLGLYSYVSTFQSELQYSLPFVLFVWGLGGFIGSSMVGMIIDLTQKPQWVMGLILLGLIITFLALPFTKHFIYFSLIPFFFWGVLGWSTTAPQQQTLFELQENQGTLLTALNSSALGLGSSLGTLMGGFILVLGFKVSDLPFFAAALLVIVLVFQMILIKKTRRTYLYFNKEKEKCII